MTGSSSAPLLRQPLSLPAQHRDAGDGREEGADQHAEANLGGVGAVVPGQGADEEAHGEADAGQKADAVDPGPAGARGLLAQAELDREVSGAEDADLLA